MSQVSSALSGLNPMLIRAEKSPKDLDYPLLHQMSFFGGEDGQG